MKVSYHGHSVVQVQTDSHLILIDPFISGNEASDLDAATIAPDFILLTHGHNDHVGDTIAIAKRTNAMIIAPYELAELMRSKGLNVHPMHIGGKQTFDFGTVKLTQAFHGSAYTEDDGSVVYTGMPAGILLTIEGKTIYHLGDTALFSDLKLIGEMNDIELAFIPIGDNFTMGPEDALIAAKWINANKVVPIHYNTFPVIEQDAEAFASQVEPGRGIAMTIGESVSL